MTSNPHDLDKPIMPQRPRPANYSSGYGLTDKLWFTGLFIIGLLILPVLLPVRWILNTINNE